MWKKELCALSLADKYVNHMTFHLKAQAAPRQCVAREKAFFAIYWAFFSAFWDYPMIIFQRQQWEHSAA